MTNEEPKKHVSQILARAQFKRLEFDASNITHRRAYAYFLAKGRWQDGITFYVEQPFTNAPSMIEHKLLRHFLRNEIAKYEDVLEAA